MLHEFDVKALFLHFVEDAHSLFGLPGLVRIDAHADVLRHRRADGRKARHIQRRIAADLHLQAIIAALHRVDGIPRHFLRVVYAYGDVRHDALARTARSL